MEIKDLVILQLIQFINFHQNFLFHMMWEKLSDLKMGGKWFFSNQLTLYQKGNILTKLRQKNHSHEIKLGSVENGVQIIFLNTVITFSPEIIRNLPITVTLQNLNCDYGKIFNLIPIKKIYIYNVKFLQNYELFLLLIYQQWGQI